MNLSDQYEEYLSRWEGARGERKKLTQDDYEQLTFEFERLTARMDPDDIQLDEWKRLEELRFLLLLPSEDEEEQQR
jgi:Na+-transporting NADH:ubiquinone oxidoreductase subunit NqrF